MKEKSLIKLEYVVWNQNTTCSVLCVLTTNVCLGRETSLTTVVDIGLKCWVKLSHREGKKKKKKKKQPWHTLLKQEQRAHGKYQVWHGKDKEQTLLCTYHSKII